MIIFLKVLPFDVTGVDCGQRIGNNVSSNIGLVAWLPSSGKKIIRCDIRIFVNLRVYLYSSQYSVLVYGD